jgi:hypothetical protein
LKLNRILPIILITVTQANVFEKITGLEKCLPRNIKIENRSNYKSNFEIIKFIDTSKFVNIKKLSITLCFISENNQSNNFVKDTSHYMEFDKYDTMIIFKQKDKYFKNLDYLIFIYTIRKILSCYYKIDKPIGPGYGKN